MSKLNGARVLCEALRREGATTIRDHVLGEVTVENQELDDLIILRSDGTPTYNFSVVVDDHDMGISHVIRGDDHLNNAFRQTQIYRALDWPIPEFGHLPLIHGADGAKLSKRHGAVGVEAYREMGYLPEALCNYLMRLGWSHGDDEIIPIGKAIEWFDIADVNRGAARFDPARLDSINAHYIREADDARLLRLVAERLEELQHQYQKKCPECKRTFWIHPEQVKTNWMDGSFEGYRCPERGCDGVVKWKEERKK